MSIEQTHVVDFIGINDAATAVVLTIADNLPWSDETQHLQLLQDKINAYLAFIESGEMLVEYPSATGRPVELEIVGRYRLPERGLDFFRKAQQRLELAGYTLTFKQFSGNSDER